MAQAKKERAASNIPTGPQQKKNRITVAILPIRGLGGVSTRYSILARDFIEEEFVRYPEYQVVDRNELKKILKEIERAQLGLISEKYAKIGKLTGARFILTGNLAVIKDIWTLSCRLIEVRNGKVFKTSIGRVSTPEKLDGAAKGCSRRLTGRMR